MCQVHAYCKWLKIKKIIGGADLPPLHFSRSGAKKTLKIARRSLDSVFLAATPESGLVNAENIGSFKE